MEEGKVYLSKQKYKELEDELSHLKTDRRKEIAEHLEYAKSLGDLSENAEYHDARDQQAKNEARILQVEDMLKKAVILERHTGSTIDVGSTVLLKKVKEGTDHTYDIVGPEEADMASGKLSYESPLGKELIGKSKGDEFSFKTPKGNVKYKVKDVK